MNETLPNFDLTCSTHDTREFIIEQLRAKGAVYQVQTRTFVGDVIALGDAASIMTKLIKGPAQKMEEVGTIG